MLLQEFPNLYWLKQQIKLRNEQAWKWQGKQLIASGWPTVILNVESSATYRPNIEGPLSLFVNFSGQSKVVVDQQTTLIPDNCFFLTNSQQQYSLEIPKQTITETFNIHFGDLFVAEAINTLIQKESRLLDQPFTFSHPPIHFFNRLYLRNTIFNQLLQQIQTAYQQPCPPQLFIEEKLYELLFLLIRQHEQTKQQLQQLTVTKKTTRRELSKRLFRVVDYIYAYYNQNLSLQELAGLACLSKYHFLRSFKSFFQQTPHQFIIQLRLNKAMELLQHTQFPIHYIATAIGLENSSSFSRLFYRKYGCYPTKIRAIEKKNKTI